MGSAPAGYRVHYTRVDCAGVAAQVDTIAPNVTLSGLQAGAAYDVQVSALHSAGWESARTGAVRLVVTSGADGNGDGLPDDRAAANGVDGGANDPDGDGLDNAVERAQGTNPTLQDSDGDTFSDGEEVAAVTDPLDAVSYSAIFTQPRLTLGKERLVFHTKLQTSGEIAPTATISWTNTGGETGASRQQQRLVAECAGGGQRCTDHDQSGWARPRPVHRRGAADARGG